LTTPFPLIKNSQNFGKDPPSSPFESIGIQLWFMLNKGLQNDSSVPHKLWGNRYKNNIVIRKVRKIQHRNPEFGHPWGGIFKKPSKMYININNGGGVKLKIPSILVIN
jgi:hypothetical protein